jgi:hypothetical protein
MNHGKFREAFLQGEEREASNLLRQSIRIGLLEAVKEEVEALCGPRYRPAPTGPCYRAGSESGVGCMDGVSEPIERPRLKLGPLESVTAVTALMERLTAGVEAFDEPLDFVSGRNAATALLHAAIPACVAQLFTGSRTGFRTPS